MAKVSSSADEPRRPGGALPLPKIKRGAKGYLREVRLEMRNISWPTRTETLRLTGVVLGVCGIVVVILTVLSKFFETVVDLVTKGTL